MRNDLNSSRSILIFFPVFFWKCSNFSNQCKENESEMKYSVEKSQGSGSAESVKCPVCGAQLPGQDNSLINSHLGCAHLLFLTF